MAVSVDSFQLIMDDLLPVLRRTEEVLAILGLLYVGKVALTTAVDILVGFRAHVFSKIFKKNLASRYGGNWAVVTGCTDGIGKGYAEELAKDGINIILISRTMSKLEQVAAEIEQKYKVSTEVIQVDFSDGRDIYDKIFNGLKKKEIGVLVNNVGVMLSHPKYFENVTDAEIWGHVNVNIGSMPSMVKLVLPGMVSRGKGAIVNLGSIASGGPIPLMGIYSASKAFVDNFSQALTSEYSGKGITVQTVNPSYVATKMVSFSKLISTPTFLTPDASTFARHALATLGHTSRTSGYWVHGIMTWFTEKVLSKWVFMLSMKQANIFFLQQMKTNAD